MARLYEVREIARYPRMTISGHWRQTDELFACERATDSSNEARLDALDRLRARAKAILAKAENVNGAGI